MSSKQAIKDLEEKGFKVLRSGKGDHVILTKGNNTRIIIPNGKSELSLGMVRKVRSYLRK